MGGHGGSGETLAVAGKRVAGKPEIMR
jgi:hypothetical protein